MNTTNTECDKQDNPSILANASIAPEHKGVLRIHPGRIGREPSGYRITAVPEACGRRELTPRYFRQELPVREAALGFSVVRVEDGGTQVYNGSHLGGPVDVRAISKRIRMCTRPEETALGTWEYSPPRRKVTQELAACHVQKQRRSDSTWVGHSWVS